RVREPVVGGHVHVGAVAGLTSQRHLVHGIGLRNDLVLHPHVRVDLVEGGDLRLGEGLVLEPHGQRGLTGGDLLLHHILLGLGVPGDTARALRFLLRGATSGQRQRERGGQKYCVTSHHVSSSHPRVLPVPGGGVGRTAGCCWRDRDCARSQ